jgi:hypothetical protein
VFVRDKDLSKKLQVLHVPASDQLADPLTKPLSSTNFADLRSKLKVFSLSWKLFVFEGGVLEYTNTVHVYVEEYCRIYNV